MNENQPTSACCGAEIVRKPGKDYAPLLCAKCGKLSQLPASKGEGWEWFDALFPTRIFIKWGPDGAPDEYMEVDRENVMAHIQTAIDEAVREATEGVPLPFLPDKLQRKYVDDTVQRPMPNPHSPQ